MNIPTSSVVSTKKWLSENTSRGEYQKVYDKEVLNFESPINHNSECKDEFDIYKNHSLKESFVVSLKYARVWSPDGNIISSDNKLLCDISREFYGGENNHRIYSQKELPPIENISGKVAVLSARCAKDNYFHWLFELMPRFHLISKSHFFTDFDYYLVSNLNYKFQKETLEILGIPKNKVISSIDYPHLRVQGLITSSLPPFDGCMSTWSCTFLRDLFFYKLKDYTPHKIPSKHVYISRRNCKVRKVLNEKSLKQVLSAYGFKEYILEELSLLDQVCLFSSSNIVISPHGAGLSNLVFCNPGTIVLELFPNIDRIEPVYWYLSNILKLNYYYMLSENTPNEDENLIINEYKVNSFLNDVFK